VVQASAGEHRDDGLTTAATGWAAAGIGVATRFRHYLLAVIVTGLALFVLRVPRRLEGPDGSQPAG
jgi:uncharacterized membrane protein YhiD involved in acid resistance